MNAPAPKPLHNTDDDLRARELRSITCWDDLRAYGIDLLTGEACGLAMRFLCDVTVQGRTLIEGFLSVKLVDDSNWNNGRHEVNVASVMLPRSIFSDLAAYVLVATRERSDTSIAAFADGGAVEFTGQHRMPSMLGRYYARSSAPGTGLRNQHMATGRVA